MPSKTKKHSKTASKLSHPDLSTSPCSSSSVTPLPDSEISEEYLLCSLDKASSKFPSLIGKSTFVGRITDIVESKECKIWLSESSMVAFSLAPGSTVSVSLASSGTKFSNDFPIISLADELARNFGLCFGNRMVDQVGNYFALATVFPSCKILKNGVRLSSNLSCTMGCPSLGRMLFVYPLKYQSVMGLVNGNDKFHGTAVSCLSLYKCKELYLELVSSKGGFMTKSYMSSPNKFPADTTQGQLENSNLSSPKTPSFSKSKLSSPSSQLSSPRYEESLSNSPNLFEISLDLVDIREVLRDETPKNLLQTCITSWLSSRILLTGNTVSIPILSKICIFQVIAAKSMVTNSTNQDLTIKSKCDLFLETPSHMDHVNGAFVVDYETKVYIDSPPSSAVEKPEKRDFPHAEIASEDIKVKLGGISKEYKDLKDLIIYSTEKCILPRFGLRPTKGVLLHGPPGTGKTTLARLCVHDTGVKLFSVNGPEIISQYYGESEQALHEVFKSASQAAPAVVFIDEVDAIAPARKDGSEELSQRLVAALLNLMDGISRTDGILVIAATNRPDSIEPALRRPGRLDREIEIGVPSPKQRYDIFLALLTEMEHSLSDMQVHQLATSTHGFVGADLAALCNEAALVCLRHYVDLKKSCDMSHFKTVSIVNGSSSTDTIESSDCPRNTSDFRPRENLESISSTPSDLHILSASHNGVNTRVNEAFIVEENSLKVTFEDFEVARMKIRPSAMREVILEVPKVSWEDVGGQREVKIQLMEAVEWPQKHQDAFKRIGTRPPSGVLMFGPPGCSKTLLARAVASEAGLNFLAVKGPELFSKWVGESEKAVRSLFSKARANAPSIIFFDELDGLAGIRGKESDGVSVADRVMSQLLVELDGLQERGNVTVIAATNRPSMIDDALLRPGRFDRLLYVGPPNKTDREDIFRVHLRRVPCHSDVCIKELALLTEGYTGADVSLICREAAVAAIEESLDATEITMEHLRSAIKQVQPSEIESDQEFTKFRRHVLSSATRN